jgi:hydroxylaminobenzene mutase
MNSEVGERLGHRLLQYGMVLFLLGLLTGFVIPAMANARMGLSSHLEGVMNGMFLLVLGVVWPKLRLGSRASTTGFWLAVFGTYANWATTLAAGFMGAGEKMMPIAAKGHTGTDAQELLITFGLVALSVAMVAVSGLVLSGLRGGPEGLKSA